MPVEIQACSPLLVVISAPSGGGKTTLCQQLLAAYPQLTRAVTCTTRPPRSGEREGIDYYFVAPSVFDQRERAGEFLEHAVVYGHRYGTLRSELLNKLAQGHDVLLAVDVQGVASLRVQAQREPVIQRALITVFLSPPSLEVLEERLRRRGTDTATIQQERLGQARQEIAQWRSFDYLLVSDSIAEDLRRMKTIIDAERLRSGRHQPPGFEDERP